MTIGDKLRGALGERMWAEYVKVWPFIRHQTFIVWGADNFHNSLHSVIISVWRPVQWMPLDAAQCHLMLLNAQCCSMPLGAIQCHSMQSPSRKLEVPRKYSSAII